MNMILQEGNFNINVVCVKLISTAMLRIMEFVLMGTVLFGKSINRHGLEGLLYVEDGIDYS